jgi:E3 ubiquitin-protein ligase RBBP6
MFSISEYTNEAALIPRNTSVLIRRVPGRPRMPIVADLEEYFIYTFS